MRVDRGLHWVFWERLLGSGALVADGEEVEAIAARLGVATSTVRTQLKSVFTKMGVSRQLGVARLVRGLPQFDG